MIVASIVFVYLRGENFYGNMILTMGSILDCVYSLIVLVLVHFGELGNTSILVAISTSGLFLFSFVMYYIVLFVRSE